MGKHMNKLAGGSKYNALSHINGSHVLRNSIALQTLRSVMPFSAIMTAGLQA